MRFDGNLEPRPLSDDGPGYGRPGHPSSRFDPAAIRDHSGDFSVLYLDLSHFRLLMDVPSAAIDPASIGPDDGIVADDAAGGMIQGRHDGKPAMPEDIEIGNDFLNLARVDDPRVA